MTDNEMIKSSLESVAEWFTEHGRNTNTAVIEISRSAIDLIKRQQAEIDRLQQLVNLFIDAQNEMNDTIIELKAEIERLTAFKSYFDELYGKGLGVANWHENGELEPFDNFYDEAVNEMVGED